MIRLTLALPILASLAGAPAFAGEVAQPAAPVVKKLKAAKADPLATGSVGAPAAAIPFNPDGSLVHWYVERGDVRFPGDDRLVYCHGYGCTLRKTVELDGADLKALSAIFATRNKSAEQEREAIDLAVSWWEKRAAPLLGGPLDIRGSDYAHSGQAGQTDCLDEATNSTTILVYLQRHNLLRYHRVERPESRGGIMIGVVHATAVFTEVADGKEWVVDSWMRDSGDPNDVMTREKWLSEVF